MEMKQTQHTINTYILDKHQHQQHKIYLMIGRNKKEGEAMTNIKQRIVYTKNKEAEEEKAQQSCSKEKRERTQ